jgi:hypothetical protein
MLAADEIQSARRGRRSAGVAGNELKCAPFKCSNMQKLRRLARHRCPLWHIALSSDGFSFHEFDLNPARDNNAVLFGQLT